MPNQYRILPHSLCAAALALLPASAIAQTKDNAPVALESADQLTQDKPRSESWTYVKPTINTAKYEHLIIEKTAVYDGPDAQFDGIDPADRTQFAGILTAELRSELGKVIPLTTKAGRNTMRLQVTILGAEKTKGGVATATRATPIGLGLNALKSVAGKPGSLTGSVLLAVELFDAQSGELLVAAVRRRSPDALDIPATLSTTDTVRAVARDFARNARERLLKLNTQGAAGAR